MLDPHITNFVDLLEYRATQQPNKTAYIFLANGDTESETEHSRITYGQLQQQSQTLAAHLLTKANVGDRALLLYPSGLDFIVTFFACLRAGIIAVPIYPPRRNQSLTRLQSIATDSQPTLALTTQKNLTDITNWETPPLNSEVAWIATNNLSKPTETGEMPILRNPSTSHSPLSHSPAFLQYTSGSTGTPKGVIVTHTNLIHNSRNIYTCFSSSPDHIGVSWLPFHHDMGLIGGVLQTVYGGGSVVIIPPVAFLQKPLRWLQAISHYKAVTSGGPNFAYDLCAQTAASTAKPEQLAALDLSNWSLAFTGAEPIRPETLAKFTQTFAPYGFQHKTFYPCYGMAETTLLVTGGNRTNEPVTYTVDRTALERNQIIASSIPTENKTLIGCGHTWLSQQVKIVDPDTLLHCGPGKVGEIWVSGGSIAKGYWQRPEQTEETFQAHIKDSEDGPYLRTGDLGFLKDQELFITGRLKDVIIIRGRNYYPQDIELTAETAHEALQSNGCAAFSVEKNSAEQLVVVQEIKRPYLRQLNDEQIKQKIILAIRRAISETHELQLYAVVLLKPGSLPKTSSGKVQRKRCKRDFLLEQLGEITAWKRNLQPNTAEPNPTFAVDLNTLHTSSEKIAAVETWLTQRIAQRVQISPAKINRQEPLASYGLSSLQVIEMSTELEAWLDRPILPTIVYDFPTIAALSTQLIVGEHPTAEKKQTFIPQNNNIATDEIAVVGIGCRFPGAPTVQAFWQLLHKGQDAITETPLSRWDITDIPLEKVSKYGGFLKQIDQFDPKFFGISPREAIHMDPQQRLLLEICWETLENAGIAADQLEGSQSGIFLGVSNGDYSRLQGPQLNTDVYYGTGNAFSITANRLSYFFDWHGPSCAIDTACSSSLVAVHQACNSLKQEECNFALAGGINLILNPQLTVTFSQAQMMAADGRCKTFDASADGYVRSEGCGIIALKRLSDAQADGNHILGIVKGSAINQDGRSNGLTAPNSLAQQNVIRQAIANAGITAPQVDYIEAHGTGTSLGDPIEVNALKNVFSQPRENNNPHWLGSVKTNIGHLEPAAGIAGIIKAILSLQNEEIPAHLHLQTINPYIQIEDSPLDIPTTSQPWKSNGTPRIAGISSFGFGGTNAHVIVSDYLAQTKQPAKSQSSQPVHLLTLSAKSEQGLKDLVLRYQDFLKANDHLAIEDICHIANTGRSHHPHRLAITITSITKLQSQLQAITNNTKPIGIISGKHSNQKPPQIAFLFTGQGSQYFEMGKELYDTQPLFHDTLNECAEILIEYNIDLIELLYKNNSDNINQTAYTQPALFSIEYALSKLWQSWDIIPDIVLGHSVGEYAAACIAGVFSLKDGLKLIAERGKLMQSLPAGGAMLSLLATEAQVKELIEPYQENVSIAAINGPESIVISGTGEDLSAIALKLEQQQIKHKRLTVSHAFHSPLMKPILEDFANIAKTLTYSAPKTLFLSCLTGQLITHEIATPDYWINHIQQPVQFASAINTLHQKEYRLLLEIGPKPLLLGMAQHCLPNAENIQYLPTLRPPTKKPGKDHPKDRKSDWQQLLTTLSHLYIQGLNINWKTLYPTKPDQPLFLPTYPFQRQRYWIEPSPLPTSHSSLPALSTTTKLNHHPLLGQPLPSPLTTKQFQTQINTHSPHYLTDHRIFGQAILPATAYLEIALAAGAQKAAVYQAITLKNISIQRGLILPEKESVTIQTVLAPQKQEAYQFQIFSLDSKKENDPRWTEHTTGTIETTETALPAAIDLEACQADFLETVPVETYYQKLRNRGLEYGPTFQTISQLWRASNQVLAQITLPEELDHNQYQIHPALLDASFQILAAAISENKTDETNNKQVYLPAGVEQLTLYAPVGNQVWAIGSISQPENTTQKQLLGNIQLLDDTGNILAEIKGLILKQTNKDILLRFLQPALPPSLHTLIWEKLSLTPQPTPILSENWLLFLPNRPISRNLTETLQSQGHNCIQVHPSNKYQQIDAQQYHINPNSPDDYHQLIHSLPTSIKGIVYLWSLESTRPSQDVLHLTQALTTSHIATNLWLITRGIQLIEEQSRSDQSRPVQLATIQQSTLWGLGRVIALEHPELNCRRVDLETTDNVKQLTQELLSPHTEDQIAYRNGDRYIARLTHYDPNAQNSNLLKIPTGQSFQLKLKEYGLIDNLTLQPTQRKQPAPREVEIQVAAAGLNFRDVLNVLGLLKDYYAENLGITHANQLTFGFECTGTIVAKGTQVTHLNIGDPVIATMLTDGVSRFVTTRSEFVIPKPDHIPFDRAASLPLAFLTAYYGLHHLAQLKPDDTVLIHAAAGGVGQAAVQIAQAAGAEIFATASPSKWDFLKAQGITHIMNSRTLTFTEEIMKTTNGRGVDVILNSLNGEYIDKSFAALSEHGRFVELGKIGIWDRPKVKKTYPNAQYFPFDLGEVTKTNPALIRDLWTELHTHFEQQHFTPLPIKAFSIQQTTQAFRYIQQAKHIGKVILTFPTETSDRAIIQPNSNYLITGGLGALGLQVAQWLTNKGATHITLLGRNKPSKSAQQTITQLTQSGVSVNILQADVANLPSLQSALTPYLSNRGRSGVVRKAFPQEIAPLKGIIHTAGILEDGLISRLSWPQFEQVMAPKVQGTWHLHQQTQSLSLDFFVCFSSIASLIGSPGQANYSAANAFMDTLMQHRRANGLPGLSVNWGPWANAGMATQLDSNAQKRMQARGVNPITSEQGLQMLEDLLTASVNSSITKPTAQVGAFSINWNKFIAQLPPGVSLPVLKQFEEQLKLNNNSSQGDRLQGLKRLKQIPPADRRQHLMQHIQTEIADVLGYSDPKEIALDQPLGDLGVDSLMAVELANQLEYNLGPTIPASFLFEHPTLKGLVTYLTEQLSEVEFGERQ